MLDFTEMMLFFTCQKSGGRSGCAKICLGSVKASSSEEDSELEDESAIKMPTDDLDMKPEVLPTRMAAPLNLLKSLFFLPFSSILPLPPPPFRSGLFGEVGLLAPGLGELAGL